MSFFQTSPVEKAVRELSFIEEEREKSFDLFFEKLSGGEAEVTFFGRRVVVVKHEKISLDFICRTFKDTIKGKYGANESIHAKGKNISNMITQYYRASDEKLKEKSQFTKLMLRIREWLFKWWYNADIRKSWDGESSYRYNDRTDVTTFPDGIQAHFYYYQTEPDNANKESVFNASYQGRDNLTYYAEQVV